MPTLQQAQKWYSTNDPVHGFDHVLRVYKMAEKLARIEGADLEIVRAAALLHDAEGSTPDNENNRATHHEASASFAREILQTEGWSEVQITAVEHCIRAHRYRTTETPQTLEAKVLFDADKLDVLGAFGAARTIAYAAQANQPIFAKPSAQFEATGKKEPGEPHSSYHEYLFKLRRVKDRLFTSEAKRIAEARHTFLVAFYAQILSEAEGLS
ncbi:MAG: HD domain-containing protein [Anaerolineales bacterium]